MSSEDADPIFFGFGAFETTAFVTSVLVAFYSLISNPTGRQRATDQAEYQVYAGWRNALLTIILQAILMVVVIVDIVVRQRDVPDNARVWLILLMLTPWAPLAGEVRDTLTSGVRVCQMMRSRLTRNELSATIRDRFKFGQRGISIPTVLYHMQEGTIADHQQDETSVVLAALQECQPLKVYQFKLAEQANTAARYDDDVLPNLALRLGNLWVVNQGPQPSSISKFVLTCWALVARIDILARLCTVRRISLRADCMQNMGIALDEIMLRARVLDVVDTLQQGGTMSDDVVERTLARKFCERCVLSSRVTVESFLESSERGHTDLRAEVWMMNLNFDWRGEFERIIDSMWEATFIENGATKLNFDPADKSSKYGDRAKAITTKMMATLFLIARSLLHTDDKVECVQYQKIAEIVNTGPFVKEWWVRYWSCVAESFQSNDHNFEDGIPEKLLLGGVGAKFKAALRKLIDEDMARIVSELVENPVMSICSEKDCLLHKAKIIVRRV